MIGRRLVMTRRLRLRECRVVQCFEFQSVALDADCIISGAIRNGEGLGQGNGSE
jgi:hypothetical protein